MRLLTADFPEKNTYVFNSNIESYIPIHSKQLWFEDNEIEMSILFFHLLFRSRQCEISYFNMAAADRKHENDLTCDLCDDFFAFQVQVI